MTVLKSERNNIVKFLMALMLANPFGVMIDASHQINIISQIITRRDDREWIFEERPDGHVYKRLYNHTIGKWETDWILVY